MIRIFLIINLLLIIFNGMGCEKISNIIAGKKDSDAAQKIESKNAKKVKRQNGLFVIYYDNGKIKAERNYQDGRLEGVYKMYYENGNLKLEGYYENDKMNGVFKRYYEDRTLKSEEVYKDNILQNRKVFDRS
jgi:antitoxin component YwqK of YwqJK toxin-antitoxin module